MSAVAINVNNLFILKPFCLTIKNWCKDTHILLKSLYLVFGSYYLYRRFLSNSFNDLFIRSIRQDFFQMLENPLIRFLGSAVALASLLGATGNHPAYAPLLKVMGAADADNYLDYIKQILIKSAQEAKDAGADIPDSVGGSFSSMAARLSASKASRISQIFSNF